MHAWMVTQKESTPKWDHCVYIQGIFVSRNHHFVLRGLGMSWRACSMHVGLIYRMWLRYCFLFWQTQTFTDTHTHNYIHDIVGAIRWSTNHGKILPMPLGSPGCICAGPSKSCGSLCERDLAPNLCGRVFGIHIIIYIYNITSCPCTWCPPPDIVCKSSGEWWSM